MHNPAMTPVNSPLSSVQRDVRAPEQSALFAGEFF